MHRIVSNRSFWFMLTFFCIVGIAFGQNVSLKTIEKEIAQGKTASSSLNLTKIDVLKLSPENLALYYHLLAKIFFKENDDEKSLQNYLKAKKQYLKTNAISKAMDINLDVAFLLHAYHNDTNQHQSYMKEYMDYALASKNNATILKGYIQMASLRINKKEAKESLAYFHKAIALNKKVNDKDQEKKTYNNLAVLFSDVLNLPDSSLYYLKKNHTLLTQVKAPNPNHICYNLMNQASNYYHLHQYDKAIALLQKADKIKLVEFRKVNKGNLNHFLYLNYKEAGNLDKALQHLETSIVFHDSVNSETQETALNHINTKYKTQEKELENLTLKNNIRNSRIIMYITISLLIVILTISILAYKNISKKKKIAEQDKLIETQKLEKKLKDQELNEIDLILESQEKERQHIANELHDNLGSMLATLKLNFQNLKRQKQELNSQENKLYDKTDDLIEEAYQRVRNISHLKNLGVIGSEGLLVAVKKMAEKMTVLEKLNIHVIPFGLNERLENTIEISLFRIIQELCTNIIKHSDASDVNIYLTQGDATEINIIIEDNGKGFDPKTIVSKAGIGLKNIEKKVEQMGGAFTIDSIISKGTTIIIDMPL